MTGRSRRSEHRRFHRLPPPRAPSRSPASRSTARPVTPPCWAAETDADGELVREWDDTPHDFGRIAAMTAKQVILQRLRDADRRGHLRRVRRPGGRPGRRRDPGPGPGRAGIVASTSASSRPCCRRPSRCPARRTSTASGSSACDRGQGPPWPAGHPVALAPEPGEEAVRAGGAGDRRRHGRDRRRSLGRPATVPRSRYGPRRPGSTPRARASGRWARGCARSWASCTARRSTSSTGRRTRRVRRQRAVAGPGSRRGGRPDARAARVTVPDYQLSLAIGREGQNARLAARLTGWRIDIRPDTERPPRSGVGRIRLPPRPWEHRGEVTVPSAPRRGRLLRRRRAGGAGRVTRGT